MNSMDFSRIKSCGIVPVIKVNDAQQAVPLAKALLDGGVDVIEITLRTQAALEAINRVAKELPEMLVGAGTVVTTEQLDAAEAAGATFIVSPGLSKKLVKMALRRDMPILPGVVTPTEVMKGLKLGLNVFKFFPSENYGGLATIKALCAPFSGISFIPTGGINEKNAGEYLKYEKIVAVGGQWMATEALVNEKNYAEITRRTKEAVALAKSARNV